MPIQVRLIVIGGKASKADVALKLPSVIGRSREAGLTIAHPMVSRRHCEVFEADGLLMIRDLGSLNGTLVAGQRIKESPLPPDSEFTVGPLTFRTLYECERDLSKLPPPVLAEQDVAVTAPSAPIESAAPDFQVVNEPSPLEPLPVSGPETTGGIVLRRHPRRVCPRNGPRRKRLGRGNQSRRGVRFPERRKWRRWKQRKWKQRRCK